MYDRKKEKKRIEKITGHIRRLSDMCITTTPESHFGIDGPLHQQGPLLHRPHADPGPRHQSQANQYIPYYLFIGQVL